MSSATISNRKPYRRLLEFPRDFRAKRSAVEACRALRVT
jgi:hypothetical protein